VFVCSETQDRDELFDKILTGKFEFASPFWDKISASAKVKMQYFCILCL